jgi:hypothetical protein
MALPSDEMGADSRLAVTFYKRSMKQDDESMAAGRPIFKEFDFVRICVPGDSLTEIDTYAHDEHKARFPRQWAHYQNQVAGQEDVVGTPLDQWPQVTRSQAEELRGLKFQTVESIADCSDQQLQRIGMVAGMSPHNFRLKAKAFLNLANDSAEVAQRESELQALKEENAKIKAETDAKLSKMQEHQEYQGGFEFDRHRLPRLRPGRDRAEAKPARAFLRL